MHCVLNTQYICFCEIIRRFKYILITFFLHFLRWRGYTQVQRKIQGKKIVLGRKPDDHEEEQNQGVMVMDGM